MPTRHSDESILIENEKKIDETQKSPLSHLQGTKSPTIDDITLQITGVKKQRGTSGVFYLVRAFHHLYCLHL